MAETTVTTYDPEQDPFARWRRHSEEIKAEREVYRKAVETAYRRLSNIGPAHSREHNARWAGLAQDALREAIASASSREQA